MKKLKVGVINSKTAPLSMVFSLLRNIMHVIFMFAPCIDDN